MFVPILTAKVLVKLKNGENDNKAEVQWCVHRNNNKVKLSIVCNNEEIIDKVRLVQFFNDYDYVLSRYELDNLSIRYKKNKKE